MTDAAPFVDRHDTIGLATEYARIESSERQPQVAGDAVGLLPACGVATAAA
jgi:hypothetical protein